MPKHNIFNTLSMVKRAVNAALRYFKIILYSSGWPSYCEAEKSHFEIEARMKGQPPASKLNLTLNQADIKKA